MNRYILQYKGSGTPSSSELNRIHALPGLKILDASSHHMYLVEATEEAVTQVRDMPTWVITPEKFIPVPDTRKTVRQP